MWAGDIKSEIEKHSIVNELYFYNQSKNSKKVNIGNWLTRCVQNQINPSLYIKTPIINNVFSDRKYINFYIDVIANKTKTPITIIIEGYYKKNGNSLFIETFTLNNERNKFKYDSYGYNNQYFMMFVNSVCL